MSKGGGEAELPMYRRAGLWAHDAGAWTGGGRSGIGTCTTPLVTKESRVPKKHGDL